MRIYLETQVSTFHTALAPEMTPCNLCSSHEVIEKYVNHDISMRVQSMRKKVAACSLETTMRVFLFMSVLYCFTDHARNQGAQNQDLRISRDR